MPPPTEFTQKLLDALNEKRLFQDQILDSLELTQQGSGNIAKVINELLQLGYSGLTDTLQVFTKAVYYAVTPQEGAYCNQKILFESDQGRDILRRIIWCASHEDANVSNNAKAVLSTLCGSLAGIVPHPSSGNIL